MTVSSRLCTVNPELAPPTVGSPAMALIVRSRLSLNTNVSESDDHMNSTPSISAITSEKIKVVNIMLFLCICR